VADRRKHSEWYDCGAYIRRPSSGVMCVFDTDRGRPKLFCADGHAPGRAADLLGKRFAARIGRGGGKSRRLHYCDSGGEQPGDSGGNPGAAGRLKTNRGYAGRKLGEAKSVWWDPANYLAYFSQAIWPMRWTNWALAQQRQRIIPKTRLTITRNNHIPRLRNAFAPRGQAG
jgi:hypothetical protein